MAADILLEIGISLESLQKAKARVENEIKTWKSPVALNVVDQKSLSDAEKFTKALKSEFSKIGTAIGKQDLSSYLKIEPGVAVRATQAVKAQSDAVSDSQEQLEKLKMSTAAYHAKTETMGPSLARVTSELGKYIDAEARGVTLDEAATARKNELVGAFNRLNKEQKSFLAGIDLGRLLLWAVGWKILYGTINMLTNVLQNIITTFIAVNEVIDRTRVLHQETGRTFNKTYSDLRDSLYETAMGTRVAVKDIAQAFQTLSYEGASLEMSMTALKHVRDLMIVTGEKELPVATAIIETYGLFKDKIRGATTESEKLQAITDSLTFIFTKAHVTISEYQQIMSYLAPTAADVVESYDFLIKLLVFADEHMLRGRRSAMALIQTLTGLAENTGKLSEVFGITFEPNEMITVEKVLMKIQEATKGLNEEAKKGLLQRMFKGVQLQLILALLKDGDVTLKSLNTDMKDLASSTALAADKAHFIGIAFKSAFVGVGKIISDVIGTIWVQFNTLIYNIEEKARSKEFKEAFAFKQRKGIFGIAPEPVFPERLIEAGRMGEEAFKKSLNFASTALGEKILPTAPIIFTQEEIRNGIIITGQLKNQLDIIERTAELQKLETAQRLLESSLEAAGVPMVYLQRQKAADATYLKEQKIAATIENSVGWIADEAKKQEMIAALKLNSEADRITLYKTYMSYVNDDAENQKRAQELINEIYQARYELINRQAEIQSEFVNKLIEEVKSLADELQGVTTDFVKNILSGTANIKTFLSGIMDSYKSALAEKIVAIFGEKTGIFASMASTFMSPLQKAHYKGVESAVPLIIQAHIDGITRGMSGVQTGGGGQQTTAGGGANLIQNISTLLGGEKAKTIQGYLGPTSYAGQTAQVAGMGEVPVKPSTMQNLEKTAGQVAKVGGQLMTVASFASEMADAYKYKGSGNPWGAAMSLGTSGAIAGAAVGGPIGAIIGGTVGAIYGFIRGAQSKTETETTERIIETNSILKLSQKELQIVNRNLEGIRRGFEGYILPKSAYFSERQGIEEKFSIDRQRGLF